MKIRLADQSDAAAIAAIYNEYVVSSTATFDTVPRTIEEQRSWIADRSGAFTTLVAETSAGEVSGFSALSMYRDRAAYATTVEESVYVHPNFHRQGIGSALLHAITEAARLHGFHVMIARVTSDQTSSLALHQACGFHIVGEELQVGRKFNRWLDVTVLQYFLGEPAPTTEK